jgi:hypothetical protein
MPSPKAPTRPSSASCERRDGSEQAKEPDSFLELWNNHERARDAAHRVLVENDAANAERQHDREGAMRLIAAAPALPVPRRVLIAFMQRPFRLWRLPRGASSSGPKPQKDAYQLHRERFADLWRRLVTQPERNRAEKSKHVFESQYENLLIAILEDATIPKSRRVSALTRLLVNKGIPPPDERTMRRHFDVLLARQLDE